MCFHNNAHLCAHCTRGARQAVLKRKTEEAEAARRKLRDLLELQARARRDKAEAARGSGDAKGRAGGSAGSADGAGAGGVHAGVRRWAAASVRARCDGRLTRTCKQCGDAH